MFHHRHKLKTFIARQNDEIERLGLERSGLYRKCRLEEIKLPLVSGNLKNVPMEEVRHFLMISILTI